MAKARPETISWLPWWLKGRLGRWLVRSTLLVLLVAGMLAGVIWLGHWALSEIHDQPRYRVPLADIECDVPEGLERGPFLDEVQFYSALPNEVNVLDDDLRDRLERAFAKHPWVEHVEQVTVTPPRGIAVRLSFRTPVLAVPWGGELRAVDGAGILLPKRASTHGLPVYAGTPRPPQGREGTRWGDLDLERAARKLRAGKG